MAVLDRGEQGERTWVVQTQRRVETEGRAMGYQLEAHTGESYVRVTAVEMAIVGGRAGVHRQGRGAVLGVRAGWLAGGDPGVRTNGWTFLCVLAVCVAAVCIAAVLA